MRLRGIHQSSAKQMIDVAQQSQCVHYTGKRQEDEGKHGEINYNLDEQSGNVNWHHKTIQAKMSS